MPEDAVAFGEMADRLRSDEHHQREADRMAADEGARLEGDTLYHREEEDERFWDDQWRLSRPSRGQWRADRRGGKGWRGAGGGGGSVLVVLELQNQRCGKARKGNKQREDDLCFGFNSTPASGAVPPRWQSRADRRGGMGGEG